MGQKLSKEAVFIQDLKNSLRERGIRVKKKDLLKFFLYIDGACPWFIIDGPTIHPKKWQKVGRELNDKLIREGPDSVPATVFSYWGLIRDILEADDDDPQKRRLLSVAEFCLRPLSPPAPKAPSRALPVAIDMPSEATSEATPLKYLPQQIYPSLIALRDEPLDPGDAATLEEEAARYHDQDWSSPPPYPLPPTLTGPAFLPSLRAPLCKAKADLTAKTSDSKTTKSRQRPPNKSGPKVFPVLTRARAAALEQRPEPSAPDTTEAPSDLDYDPDTDNQPSSDSEGEGADQRDYKTLQPAFKPLKFKHIKDLHNAIKNYGANAPFTLSLLESLSGNGYLLPGEWIKVIKTVVDRPQFLIWKAEFLDRAQNIASRNQRNPLAPTASWSADKICGQGKYSSEEKQKGLSPGILAQTAEAALGAWRVMPPKGSAFSPLSKITQGHQEPFAQFVARIQETVERMFGPEETEGKMVKQLILENANPACRVALRGKDNLEVSQMIRLCADIDPFGHQVGQAITMAMGAMMDKAATMAIGAVMNKTSDKSCFRCGQAGHFARQCPTNVAAPLGPETNKQHSMPLGLCPWCKRGRHWAKHCRSKTDVSGNLLPPVSGNGGRGQPRAPQPVSFLPALGNSQAGPQQTLQQQLPDQPQPSIGLPQGAQDWTSMPPPIQY
ncbi:endogenous retrovirus group K member 6 Gag polyprotein-like [Grammomys surdaster]|uniref:endogenous retrovirus group K member 6 Gag polyprotein-like n=1 Tax=Grammomys surdaster TaxID=491861 RepID=UPI0010A07A9D|nr:endogenous retrovirus group K member 6 Gag polyprotein-like [Grammomys surdaster]